jgi:RNA polymerase sigma factor (sigma-70 family)
MPRSAIPATGTSTHPRVTATADAPRTAAEATVAELLQRAADGDQSSWNALVDRYTNLLWSVARAHRLETPDAADVVQTTWLRLVEHLSSIHDPDRLPGWLATTARRECLRTLRLKGRERPTADDDVTFESADDTEALDAGLLASERDAQLWHCFGQMSGRCQQLLRILMADPPPSYNDISAALDMPVGSIGPTRGRCLERLRRLAEARGIALDGLGPVPAEEGVR